MPVVAVVGAQWGDEGKGKIVDLYAGHADIVVRYGGGANAGHTLVVNGEKVVFHLVPSGALRPKVKCVVGPGTVIDANVLLQELSELRARGLLTPGRMLLSERAHLVLPHHKLLDGFRDAQHGIGTTKRGIGPTYQDKAARRGIRLCDLTDPALLKERLTANIDAWAPIMNHAQTGQMGDGKIFVSDLAQVIRIRTGETGKDAV